MIEAEFLNDIASKHGIPSGSILRVTEISMSALKTTRCDFFYMHKDGKWFRACNDRLETAIGLFTDPDANAVKSYAREMDDSQLAWFLKYTLPKARKA